MGNFTLNVCEGVSFQIAMGFVSGTAVLPLFVAGSGHPPWALGLLGAVSMLGAPAQAPGAIWAARTRDWLRAARVQTLVPRAALVGLAVAPWLPGPIALTGFFLLLALFQLTLGFATPTWLEYVQRALPPERQGAFFGRRKAWGAGLSLVAMLLSSTLLAVLPSPWGFRACFGLAAASWLVTYPCVLATRLDERDAVPAAGFFETARGLLGSHPAFRRYLLGRCVLALASMANAFYVVYGAQRYHLPVAAATLLPVAMTVLPALAGDAWGRWIDRRGPAVLVPMAIAAALAHLVMLAVPSVVAFTVAIAAIGAAGVVVDIADGQFQLAMGAGRCGAATSLQALVLCPLTAGAPLAAGFLADAHGLPLVLGLAGLAWGLGALAFLPRVAPAVRPARL